MRPLPAEMVKYARQNTHYLINLYTHLKNDLIGAVKLVYACLHCSCGVGGDKQVTSHLLTLPNEINFKV